MTLIFKAVLGSAAGSLARACAATVLSCVLMLAAHSPAFAQDVEPIAAWASFKQIRYYGKPIRIHLLAGYGRAIEMPETVQLLPPYDVLPGCEITVEDATVKIYPRGRFNRSRLRLVGVDTGIVYELQVRASMQGRRRSLKIIVPDS